MKSICWITADYFADCDFVPIGEVSKQYRVKWIVLMPKTKSRYKESDFIEYINEHKNVEIFFYHSRYRWFDPREITDNINILKLAKSMKCDYFYVNMVASSPSCAILWNGLPKQHSIITAHHGYVHEGFKRKWIHRLSRKLVYSFAPHVNMFSESQSLYFVKDYPKSKITIIPLSIKDYGDPSIDNVTGKTHPVVFLSFGQIFPSKNIDLLIKAGCRLYEDGVRDFKIKIWGYCKEWNCYQKLIKYPDMFDTDIRVIPNEEIPNLFASSHYFMQPYKAASQSGSIKVAYRYNLPVIASDIPGLIDDMKDGESGFIFKNNDIDDLVEKMKYVIENHEHLYDDIKEKNIRYVQDTYSNDSIGRKYIEMFDKLQL